MIRSRIHPEPLLGFVLAAVMSLPGMVNGGEQSEDAPADTTKPVPENKEAPKSPNLPGIKINLKERCVDVDSTICLDEGMLEFIACTKDTKEHESIIVIKALPRHVHIALLLLGAKPGNPAMRKPLDAEKTRWVDIPPRGDLIDAFLVFKNDEGKLVEKPISDFLTASGEEGGDREDAGFPTHTFIFAGSVLHGDGPGPRKYLCDQTGSVISIATFGDELLCLPGVHSHANGMLSWQIDDTDLPAAGSAVTLRLRPQGRGNPGRKTGKKPDEKSDKAPGK